MYITLYLIDIRQKYTQFLYLNYLETKIHAFSFIYNLINLKYFRLLQAKKEKKLEGKKNKKQKQKTKSQICKYANSEKQAKILSLKY